MIALETPVAYQPGDACPGDTHRHGDSHRSGNLVILAALEIPDTLEPNSRQETCKDTHPGDIGEPRSEMRPTAKVVPGKQKEVHQEHPRGRQIARMHHTQRVAGATLPTGTGCTTRCPPPDWLPSPQNNVPPDDLAYPIVKEEVLADSHHTPVQAPMEFHTMCGREWTMTSWQICLTSVSSTSEYQRAGSRAPPSYSTKKDESNRPPVC